MAWGVKVFSLLLLFAATVLAAEHRVTTPAEIAAAAETAAPGDVLVMSDGSWTDVKIVFEAKGTAEKPITLRAETPGKVVITGQSVLRLAGEYLVVEGLRFERCGTVEDVCEFRAHTKRHAYHSRLTACAFIDCNPPDAKNETRWVSLYGADNRVDHCYLAGKTNRGTTLVVWLENDPVSHRIDHNHFGPRSRLKVNGGETVRVGDSKTSGVAARCTVEENLFERCSGEVEIVSNKSSENLYRKNVFQRCEGALTLRHGHACTVEGNVFLGEGQPHTGGVRVIDADHRVIGNRFTELFGEDTRAALCLMNGLVNSPANGYFPVRRATIAGNTFTNCRESIVLGWAGEGGTLPPEDCTFADNTIVSKHAPLVRTITAPLRTTWKGNTMSGADTGLPAQAGIVVAEVKPGPVDVPVKKADVGPAWLTER
jgi:poly(beta-D-mannuronate) lyase